jgi:hypothetical protein
MASSSSFLSRPAPPAQNNGAVFGSANFIQLSGIFLLLFSAPALIWLAGQQFLAEERGGVGPENKLSSEESIAV